MSAEDRTIEQLKAEIGGLRRRMADLETSAAQCDNILEKIVFAKKELEQTFDAVPDLIAMIDMDYRLIRVNRTLAERLKSTPRELVGSPCYHAICGHDKPPGNCPHSLLMTDGKPHTEEIVSTTLGGDFAVTAVPLLDYEDQLIGCVHIARDITEWKRVEETLRQNEERFRNLVETTSDWIWETDDKLLYTYVSPRVTDILGYAPQEVIGRNPFDLMAPEEVTRISDQVLRGVASREPFVYLENVNLHKDGRRVVLETSGLPFFDKHGRFCGYRGIDRDITLRKEAEREREYAQKFLQSVIDGVNEQIMVIGADYRVKLMNQTAKAFLSDDGHCYEVSHNRETPCDEQDYPCCLKEVLRLRKPVTVTHRHVRKDGTESLEEIYASPIFDESGDVVYVVEALRDITERVMLEEARKKLDERLYQEQKEESILTLAGGIAHDFNNSLMGVLGNAELLSGRLPEQGKEREMAENIIRSAERMADLTKQLLAYARSGIYQPRPIQINQLIREALNLTHKGKALDIEVVLDLAEDLWPVVADPAQMDQVLINLFLNAFEAMERERGSLTVYSANLNSGKVGESTRLKPEGRDKDYVYLRVSDTGPGIPEELRDRIFEPFVTTKSFGRGLGLAAVTGIVQRHGGSISLESRPGEGTTVHIYLPRAEIKPTGAVAERLRSAGEEPVPKILVVDDEPQILTLLKEILTQTGHAVVTVGTASGALDIFRKEKDAIKLAILDIQMPDMDGKRLFVEMKKLKPDLKVLISTGYDEMTVLDEMGSYVPEGFVQKPYRSKILKEKVEELLA